MIRLGLMLVFGLAAVLTYLTYTLAPCQPVGRKRRAAAHATWPPGRPFRVGETDWCNAPTAGNRTQYSRRIGAHRRRARAGRPASCAAAAGSGETRQRVRRDRRTPPLALGRGGVPGFSRNNLGTSHRD